MKKSFFLFPFLFSVTLCVSSCKVRSFQSKYRTQNNDALVEKVANASYTAVLNSLNAELKFLKNSKQLEISKNNQNNTEFDLAKKLLSSAIKKQDSFVSLNTLAFERETWLTEQQIIGAIKLYTSLKERYLPSNMNKMFDAKRESLDPWGKGGFEYEIAENANIENYSLQVPTGDFANFFSSTKSTFEGIIQHHLEYLRKDSESALFLPGAGNQKNSSINEIDLTDFPNVDALSDAILAIDTLDTYSNDVEYIWPSFNTFSKEYAKVRNSSEVSNIWIYRKSDFLNALLNPNPILCAKRNKFCGYKEDLQTEQNKNDSYWSCRINYQTPSPYSEILFSAVSQEPQNSLQRNAWGRSSRQLLLATQAHCVAGLNFMQRLLKLDKKEQKEFTYSQLASTNFASSLRTLVLKIGTLNGYRLSGSVSAPKFQDTQFVTKVLFQIEGKMEIEGWKKSDPTTAKNVWISETLILAALKTLEKAQSLLAPSLNVFGSGISSSSKEASKWPALQIEINRGRIFTATPFISPRKDKAMKGFSKFILQRLAKLNEASQNNKFFKDIGTNTNDLERDSEVIQNSLPTPYTDGVDIFRLNSGLDKTYREFLETTKKDLKRERYYQARNLRQFLFSNQSKKHDFNRGLPAELADYPIVCGTPHWADLPQGNMPAPNGIFDSMHFGDALFEILSEGGPRNNGLEAPTEWLSICWGIVTTFENMIGLSGN